MKRITLVTIAWILIWVLCFSTICYGECVVYYPTSTHMEHDKYIPIEDAYMDRQVLQESSVFLAPGVKETSIISMEEGNKQHVEYACEIDLSQGGAEFVLGHQPGKLESVSEQIDYAEAETGKDIIAGVNGCFFEMDTAEANGLLISEGKVLHEARFIDKIGRHMYENVFAITNEGEAVILNTRDLCYDKETDTYTPIKDGDYWFAVNGNAIILKDDIVTGSPVVFEHQIDSDARGERHARTAVGIKDDGSVVLFSTSGKMSPFNYGYTNQHVALVMKSMGCHTALMLDGGGSSTYVSQHPGETEEVCRTFSSEGTQRKVCSGVLVARTGKVETSPEKLSACEKNGHLYQYRQDMVTCKNCSFSKATKDFSGLAKDMVSGRYSMFYRGKTLTGYVPYGQNQLYYFDQQGLSCPVELKADVKPSCTARGYREYYCADAPKDKRSFQFTYPKATGHEYQDKDVCTVCGWEKVSLKDCNMKLSYTKMAYTGKKRTPSVTVTAPNGKKLTRKSGSTGDYSMSVSNNVEIGTATLTFVPLTYYVNLMEDRGSVAGTQTVEYQILPSPPTNLHAASTGIQSAKLAWTASASAAAMKENGYAPSYDVYQKIDNQWKKIGNTATTSYTVKGLQKATSYQFRVCTVTTGKDGNPYQSWKYAVAKIKTEGLDSPANVKASNVAKTGKVKLTWSKVKGADCYKIYRSTSKNGKYSHMLTTTKNSYINTSSKAGKSYYYKVKAICKADTKKNSNYSKAVKRTCDLARPVVKIGNDKKTGKPKLTWKKVSGAEKYKVYSATSKNGKYTYVTTVKGVNYVHKSAKKGKTYWYKIKAIDAGNDDAASAYSLSVKRKCK